MKRFLRTLLTLTLAIALVFTMSVPVFAGEANYTYVDVKQHENKHTTDSDLSYFPLGDSIAAGVTSDNYRNLTSLTDLEKQNTAAYTYYKQFYDYWSTLQLVKTTTGYVKPSDVYAVDFSFVSEIADQIKANKNESYNGAFTGLRSKDICNLLDICDPAEGDSYNFDKDYWPKSAQFFNIFTNKQNAKDYMYAIKKADVITVELGQNDMLSSILTFATDNESEMATLLEGIGKIMYGGDIGIEKFVQDCVNLVQNPQNMIANLKALKDDLGTLYEELYPILAALGDYTKELNYKSEYYFTNMMKYIRDENPDATIVVGTVINPFKNIEDYKVVGQIMDLLYFNKINKVIEDNALKYEYYVADLSFVNMTPEENKTAFKAKEHTSETDIPIHYNFHPTYDDQMKIADAYVKQIKFAQANPNYFEKAKATEVVKDVAKVAVAGAVTGAVVSKVATKIDKAVDKYKQNEAVTEKAPVTEQTEVKQEEPAVTETVEAQKLTDEDVVADLSDATVKCTTSKTSKGIKVTAKVTDADLDAMKEAGYDVAYKFYRSTKKSSGYKYMLTSKKGTYTNTSVKKGNKYYYKTVLVVTDAEGNEVAKSVLKDCKYGARTF